MILELAGIVLVEVIILLAIFIVYWFDYTNSYIHCHCRTEPCPKKTLYEQYKDMYGWVYPTNKDHQEDEKPEEEEKYDE